MVHAIDIAVPNHPYLFSICHCTTFLLYIYIFALFYPDIYHPVCGQNGLIEVRQVY